MRTKIISVVILTLTFTTGLIVGCGGCQTKSGVEVSPTMKLNMFKQGYVEASKNVRTLIDNGTIKDQTTKDVFFYASEEAYAAIKDAEDAIAKNDFNTRDYALRRLQSVVDRLFKIYFERKRSATTQETSWLISPSLSSKSLAA